ncbi:MULTISPECIES: hypothetical protein [Metabacillus]|uniref:Uncharacterized protein n=1 Tax=Metabacillus hrfriensis TaxID=3048891 RepID=A0ACD4R6W5_9BACI|nr:MULTISPECIES: hypothetical protein [Metabacillus]UAL50727.1 hypothetical protein K8L98_15975 [Metabacillus dongyingensis]USK26997.1 hypothetical protein LIT32_16060 [Bacillus sp. CMF21]WHZ56220.1 hypothetical protein QLQ22_16130 [Metabacillus sp. CT-WN-B3]
MTKKFNKGSENGNSPRKGHFQEEFGQEIISGDNSKGNKRNKDQQSKTAEK